MKQAKSTGQHVEASVALSKSAKKNAKRKEKRKQQRNDNVSNVDVATTAISSLKISSERSHATTDSKPTQEETAKKIKNLKKKLRQIEDLETKINSGELKNPEKEQLEKVKKKQQIIDEIEDLELDLDD